MSIEKELLQMKEKVDKAKRDYDQALGALEQLTQRMTSDFGASTVEEAENMASDIQNEIKSLKADIEEKMNELREGYEWN